MAMALGINLIVFMAWFVPFALYNIKYEMREMVALSLSFGLVLGILLQALLNVGFML